MISAKNRRERRGTDAQQMAFSTLAPSLVNWPPHPSCTQHPQTLSPFSG